MTTADDVMELGSKFWELTSTHAPLETIRPMFITPTILIPSGELMSLEAHHAMHEGFRDQSHEWRTMSVQTIAEAPHRVLAVGSVDWSASFTDGRPGRIQATVGETWVIERGLDEQLRWTMYWSNSIEFAAGSATFESEA